MSVTPGAVRVAVETGGSRMVASTKIPSLERQAQRWKARAQAKQKWLEQALAEPGKTPRDTARRRTWIEHALDAVRRRQARLKYRAALIDAYTEHLSVLEMTLLSAAEQNARA